ncbi:MAG: AzlC family ABC transporter permease [Actinomycetes bacterium]|jgi:4-azaleucine resistance transporter AzlC
MPLPRVPHDLRDVVRASVVIGVASGIYAVSFGVLSVSAGASVLQTCLLSLLVFTGASQFSAVSVISAGGSVASAVSGGLLLAARNGVYGLALSPSIKGSLARRMLAAQFVIDETTAMTSAAPDQRSKDWAFWSCAVMLFACWNLGTLVGALAGSSIDPETFGLDAAFPVVFVAMVAPHLATRSGRRAALIGAAVTIVLTPFLPIGLPILLSSVGVFVGLLPRDDAGMPGRPAGEAP